MKLALLAILVSLGLAPAAHASSFWGVGATGMLEQSPQTEDMQLSLTHAVGVSLGRFGVTVDSDSQLAALADHGIEPYPMLSGDYGAFAARYGVGGSFWTARIDPVHIYEIGNEPNIATSPQQYAATYAEARSEILAHDPHAYVVAGGLAAIYPIYRFDVYDWTRQMITALGYCPDAIGYHAYPKTIEQLSTGLKDERDALNAVNCESTNIELNEFYMLGGDPTTLTEALSWLMSAKLGISRVVLELWCAKAEPSRGMIPAVALDGSIAPAGWAFLAAMQAPWPSVPEPVEPPNPTQPTTNSPSTTDNAPTLEPQPAPVRRPKRQASHRKTHKQHPQRRTRPSRHTRRRRCSPSCGSEAHDPPLLRTN